MLPYGNEIYIISSLSEAKTSRFYESKNIEQTLVCISIKIFVPDLTKVELWRKEMIV